MKLNKCYKNAIRDIDNVKETIAFDPNIFLFHVSDYIYQWTRKSLKYILLLRFESVWRYK